MVISRCVGCATKFSTVRAGAAIVGASFRG
jgi:hypothetical protein